jgi:hypothetical protein
MTAQETTLVEPDWLADHLGDPDLRLVEVDVGCAPLPPKTGLACTKGSIYADQQLAPSVRDTLSLNRPGYSEVRRARAQ